MNPYRTRKLLLDQFQKSRVPQSHAWMVMKPCCHGNSNGHRKEQNIRGIKVLCFVRLFVNGNITLLFSDGTHLTTHPVLHTRILYTKPMEALLYRHMEMNSKVCVKHCAYLIATTNDFLAHTYRVFQEESSIL